MDKYLFHVCYGDVNHELRIKLHNYESMLLNASCRASDDGGFGIPDLNRTNRTWVLARFGVNILDFPRLNDEIEIETWIEQNMMGFSVRDFAIYRLAPDGTRRHLGDCRTVWAIIDLTTRQNVNLDDIPGFPAAEDRKVEIPAMPRVDRDAARTETSYTIQYSDIDQNGHCNSACYVRMMLDALNSPDGIPARRFTVNYSHEVRFGETVCIQRTDGPNPLFKIIKADGSVAVTAHFATE